MVHRSVGRSDQQGWEISFLHPGTHNVLPVHQQGGDRLAIPSKPQSDPIAQSRLVDPIPAARGRNHHRRASTSLSQQPQSPQVWLERIHSGVDEGGGGADDPW